MHQHLTMRQIEDRLAKLGDSPKDHATLDMIVIRPAIGERTTVESADVNLTDGLIGDNWKARGSRHTDDGSAHPLMQITLMNRRIVEAISQDQSMWQLAGDQLIVDLDLSTDNMPPGQQIAIGSAILEITDYPHTGCDKFTERFGHDAIRFVNSKEGREAHRRGIYARVIQAGVIHVGDEVNKVKSPNKIEV